MNPNAIRTLLATAAIMTTVPALALTEQEKATLLDAHNGLRSDVALNGAYGQPTATNMTRLVWNETLAQTAQDYADQCIWGHNGNRNAEYQALGGTHGYIGENISVISVLNRSSAINHANQGWGPDEAVGYTFGTLNGTASCTVNSCGHYTQIVWANTREVGCGVATCPNGLTNLTWPTGTLVVCNYGPGGNYVGQTPYEAGQTASNCPTDAPDVENGLCTVLPPPPPPEDAAQLPGLTTTSWVLGMTTLIVLGAIGVQPQD